MSIFHLSHLPSIMNKTIIKLLFFMRLNGMINFSSGVEKKWKNISLYLFCLRLNLERT